MSDTNLTNLIVNHLTRKELHSADFTDHGDELFVQSDHAGVSVGGVGVDALDTTNITNCITHIPQDVKLEISNGSLILKAGSVEYKPNGAGVFDKYTHPSDTTYNFGSSTGTFLIYSSGDFFSVGDCVSGATDSKAGVARHIWYDTVNNSVKLYASDGSTPANTVSLPLGIVTVSSGVVSHIKQVFNGFGFIGNTVFVLPGVEGLIPNGFNDDGSLKNTAFKVASVISETDPNNYTDRVFVGTDGSTVSRFSSLSCKYNQYANKNENAGSVVSQCIFASVYRISGKVETLDSAIVFHAVDYSDYIRNPGTVVEFQAPTSENGYTWYRKYADGWVEQGGLCSGTAEANPVTMPIEMSDTEYQVLSISDPTDSVNSWGWIVIVRNTKTTTGFSLGGRKGIGDYLPVRTHWQVSGMAA